MEKIKDLKKMLRDKWAKYDSTEKTIDPSKYSFREKFNSQLLISYAKEQPEYAMLKESGGLLFKHGWHTVLALVEMVIWFGFLMFIYNGVYDALGFDRLIIMFFAILCLTLNNLSKILGGVICELKRLNDD